MRIYKKEKTAIFRLIWGRGAMQEQNKPAGFKALIAAVIDRAILDLKGSDRQGGADHAMAFILGEYCEAFCLDLGINYEALREKAGALYRRVIAREEPEQRRAGRPRKTLNRSRRTHTRQSLR